MGSFLLDPEKSFKDNKCSNIKMQNNFVKCDIAFKYLCPEDLYYDFYIKYINHKGILQEKN